LLRLLLLLKRWCGQYMRLLLLLKQWYLCHVLLLLPKLLLLLLLLRIGIIRRLHSQCLLELIQLLLESTIISVNVALVPGLELLLLHLLLRLLLLE